jgi:RNA polymerase-interacting CarD/CdnL/TRCF family regulator
VFEVEREKMVMTSTVKLIDEMGLLPIEERIFIVDSLLRTLNPVDKEIEAAWIAVAKQRREEIRSGRVIGIPAEEVFMEARKLFAK